MGALDVKKQRLKRLESLSAQGNHSVDSSIAALKSEIEAAETSGKPFTFSGVTIVEERYVFEHGLGQIPRNVTFYADGQPQNFPWSRNDGEPDCDEYNKVVIYSTEEVTGVEINIFC